MNQDVKLLVADMAAIRRDIGYLKANGVYGKDKAFRTLVDEAAAAVEKLDKLVQSRVE